MTIKNGETANADNVLKLTEITLKNQAQLIYNFEYIGLDAQLNILNSNVLNSYNSFWNVLSTNSGFAETLNTENGLADTSHSVYYSAAGDLIYAGDTYDIMDSPVDTGKWESLATGTLGQSDNNYVQVTHTSTSGVASLTLSASTLNIAPNTKSEAIFKIYGSYSSAAELTSMARTLSIRDDLGNQVTVYTSSAVTGSYTAIYRIVISGTTLSLYDDTSSWDLTPTDIDISSLVGTSFHLRWNQNGGRNGNSVSKNWAIRIYPICYVNGSAITSTEVTTTPITTSSNDSGYLTYNGSTTGIQASLSADGGSNYMAVDEAKIENITNTGTSFITKFAFSGSLEEMPKITEYFGAYNLY